MPAQPLTDEQKADAARLKAIYQSKKAELGLTQISLAAECGWESQGTVSQYLNGKIPLNLDAALKFKRVLKCSVADFSPRLASSLSPAQAGRTPMLADGAEADVLVAADEADPGATLDERIAHASDAVVSVLKAASLDALCFGDIQSIKAAMKNGTQETFTIDEILRAAIRVFFEKRELISDLSKEEFAEVLLAHLRAERDVIRRTKRE